MATAGDDIISLIDMTVRYEIFVMTYAIVTRGTPIIIDSGKFLKQKVAPIIMMNSHNCTAYDRFKL